MIRQIFKGVIMTLAPLLSVTSALADDNADSYNKALTKTHSKIIKNYETVPHIDSKGLSNMSPDEIILFDVREKDEYDVSHIEGAIWVDPDIDSSSFLQSYSDEIGDKIVILYCSVGVRSSRLAEKLKRQKTANTTARVYNLEKGIFGWHNEKRPLYHNTNTEKSSPTDYVHPYNFVWGRMVNRDELKSSEAASEE